MSAWSNGSGAKRSCLRLPAKRHAGAAALQRRLIERAWELARRAPARGTKGPVGVVAEEVHSLGWRWDSGPWHWDRPGDAPLPLTGGPQGHFDHEVRHAVRQRELRALEARRPECTGATRF